MAVSSVTTYIPSAQPPWSPKVLFDSPLCVCESAREIAELWEYVQIGDARLVDLPKSAGSNVVFAPEVLPLTIVQQLAALPVASFVVGEIF